MERTMLRRNTKANQWCAVSLRALHKTLHAERRNSRTSQEASRTAHRGPWGADMVTLATFGTVK